MLDVVGAFVRHEETQRRGHQRAHVIERAGARGAEERLQFGEGQFDRIEVGTVGREKSQPGAGLLNRHAYLGLLVGGEIVQHDDIAGTQRRHQDLLDVGAERHVVDRAVEDGGRRQLRGAQRRDHRVRLPVAVGRVIGNARPTKTSRVAAQQIGRHARFVHEDVLARLVERLRLAPLPARGGDIRSTLFVGVDGFF